MSGKRKKPNYRKQGAGAGRGTYWKTYQASRAGSGGMVVSEKLVERRNQGGFVDIANRGTAPGEATPSYQSNLKEMNANELKAEARVLLAKGEAGSKLDAVKAEMNARKLKMPAAPKGNYKPTVDTLTAPSTASTAKKAVKPATKKAAKTKTASIDEQIKALKAQKQQLAKDKKDKKAAAAKSIDPAIKSKAAEISTMYRGRDETGFRRAMESSSAETVKEVSKQLGYSWKGSKKKTVEFLANNVQESNKQKIRH